jgi:multiple sugar transport system ATP-binding protein
VARVRLDNVSKRFGDVSAIRQMSLDIPDRDFMILLGPSGCGKSTLLRMISGLEDPTEGEVWIGEQMVNDVEPKNRDVAMVFQSYALYPHKTVRGNIEFPLRVRGVDKVERVKAADEAAASLGLSALMDRKPGQMSGGQRQRVALARAIVRRPAVFCMDEPLSNLDAKLRAETRAELVALHARLDTTFVYVTHDQVEAMTMGTHVAVMNDGELQQVGTPQEVYARPATVFVAQFIGTPPMNIFPVGMLDSSPHLVGVRPEHLVLAPDGKVAAHVLLVEHLGHGVLVTCRLDSGDKIVVRTSENDPIPSIGDEIRLDVEPGRRHFFDAGTHRRIEE